jgi:hypothetical protein
MLRFWRNFTLDFACLRLPRMAVRVPIQRLRANSLPALSAKTLVLIDAQSAIGRQ